MSKRFRLSSLCKKYLMAITGFILVLFVLGHMAGNLQMFVSPELLNSYGHKLQTLPYNLLWVIRAGLLATVIIHVWMAISLTIENRRAHPEKYAQKNSVQATLASKTMGLTGSILLLFIVFHILHYTARVIFPEYKDEFFYTLVNGEEVYNVYLMMIVGFSKPWVSAFYILSMALLCMHLSHGVSSMFQSMGWRNKKWRSFYDKFALLYGWVVFLGFISIPVSVLISLYTEFKIFPI